MAYLRLIWMYYDKEQALPNNPRVLAFKVGSDEETISLILEAFFRLEDGVWRHSRCDSELGEYKAICDRNIANGKQGGRPKKTQSKPSGFPVGFQTVPSGNPDATQLEPSGNPNQEPVTSNQEPVNTNTPLPPKGTASGFEEFWKTYPNKSAKVEAQKSFNKIKPDHALLAKIISAVVSFKKSAKWTKDGGAFIPHAATWLNGKRWEDEVQSGGYAEPVRRQARQVYQ
jgi:hypothetical protein